MIPKVLFAQTRSGAHGEEQDLLFAASKVQNRRRWIIRTALFLGTSSILLCTLVAFRRDQSTVRDSLAAMAPIVRQLQADTDALGQLPAALNGSGPFRDMAYVTELAREYANATKSSCIVAYSVRIPLVLGADGCIVLISEAGKVRQEWWSRIDLHNALQSQDTRIRAWELARRSTRPQLP